MQVKQSINSSIRQPDAQAIGQLDVDDLRSVFELLREAHIQGDQLLAWRVHVVDQLRAFTHSQQAWISHEKILDGTSQVMLLNCGESKDGPEIYFCQGHQHPPINRFCKMPETSSQSGCPVFDCLARVRSEHTVLTSGLRLIDQTETTTIGICRTHSRPVFESRSRQILRLFIVELAQMVRRDNAAFFLGRFAIFTPRSREVIRLLAAGKTEEQIATLLGIGRHTVHRHVMDIYRRLSVFSRGEFLAAVGTMPQLMCPKISLDWPEQGQRV